MKQIATIVLTGLVAVSTNAQTKPKPRPSPAPVKKTIAPPAVSNQSTPLKNLTDSASYAIGQNLAQSITKDLKNLNKQAFIEAVQTVFDGKESKFGEDAIRSILTEFSQQEQQNEHKEAIEAGKSFLEKNKTNPNIKTTGSGLQYEVVQEGSGTKPTASDTVVCNYRGTLVDGTEFDNSYERGEPLTIKASNVIPGWTEGLQLMSKGSKYKFYIPQELGYGLRPAGQIPPGSVLIFEVELLDVKKEQ